MAKFDRPQGKPNSDNVLGDSGTRLRFKEVKTLPNLNWALRGYNILEGNPLFTETDGDQGFKSPIFQETYEDRTKRFLPYRSRFAPQFKKPNGIHIYNKDICTIDFDSVAISNEKKYHDSLSVKAGASLNLGPLIPFSFTANAEYQEKTERMTKKSSLFVSSSNECVKYEIAIDEYDPPKFSYGFKNAIIGLNTDNSSKSLEKFLYNFGTHFINKANMGARFGIESEFTSAARSKLEKEDFDFKLAVGLKFQIDLGINVDVGKKKEIEEKFEKYNVKTRRIKVGTPIPEKGKEREWANKVIRNPYPISYNLEPIENLFDANFMKDLKVDYKKIKQDIIDFKKKYCSIHQCQKPVSGCGGAKDCPENTECEEVSNGNGEKEYSCQCNPPFVEIGGLCSGWNIQKTLAHDRYDDINPFRKLGAKPGGWSLCPKNSYAYSFAMKIEADDGINDDSGLNAVRLYCKTRGNGQQVGSVSSAQAQLGTWTNPAGCFDEDKMLVGYQFKSETEPGFSGDHKFGQIINVECDDGQKIIGETLGIKPDDGGRWSSWTSCATGSGICGIQTLTIPKENLSSDDMGLLDLQFMCCKF